MNARPAAVLALAAALVTAVGCGAATEPPLPDLPATVRPPLPTTPPVSMTVTASPTPTAHALTAAPTPRPGRSWSVVVTFYGAADNDPAGSTAIAHPNALHREAGGVGSYANPLSLAADTRAIAVGTRVYYPPLRKYFVMEDDCAGCIDDWESSRTPHIDLWTGDHSGGGIIACEDALTPSGRVVVEVNPPPGRPVDLRPLYDGSDCIA